MILIDFVYTEHHQFVAMYRHGAGGHGGCGMLWPPGTKRRDRSVDPVTDVWYIYLQNWVIYRVNVGKYTKKMDHLGIVLLDFYFRSDRVFCIVELFLGSLVLMKLRPRSSKSAGDRFSDHHDAGQHDDICLDVTASDLYCLC